MLIGNSVLKHHTSLEHNKVADVITLVCIDKESLEYMGKRIQNILILLVGVMLLAGCGSPEEKVITPRITEWVLT